MTDLRTPPSRTLPPDFAEEDEVDLGRYWRPIAARWWLLLAGIVVGLILGYLVSLSSGSVWQAKALVYTGTPLAGGTNPVQSPQTNSQSVNQIVHSEAAVAAAAARCGIHPGQIRGGISTKAVGGGKGAAKTSGGGQYYQVGVQGGGARKSACPANVLAQRVVTDLVPYVATLIASLQTTLKTDTATIASIDELIRTYRAEVSNSTGLSTADRLILSSQLNNLQLTRTQFVNDQTDTRQQIAQAKFIQQPRVIERAAASKTTARSPRNSMLVGAVIGLLVGLILALVWDRLPTGALRRNG